MIYFYMNGKITSNYWQFTLYLFNLVLFGLYFRLRLNSLDFVINN